MHLPTIKLQATCRHAVLQPPPQRTSPPSRRLPRPRLTSLSHALLAFFTRMPVSPGLESRRAVRAWNWAPSCAAVAPSEPNSAWQELHGAEELDDKPAGEGGRQHPFSVGSRQLTATMQKGY
jgi:hypothetical protein